MTRTKINEEKVSPLYFAPDTLQPSLRARQLNISYQLEVRQYCESKGIEVVAPRAKRETEFGTTHAGPDYDVVRLYAGLSAEVAYTAQERAEQQFGIEWRNYAERGRWERMTSEEGQAEMQKISRKVILTLDQRLVSPDGVQKGQPLEKVPDRNYLSDMAWKPKVGGK